MFLEEKVQPALSAPSVPEEPSLAGFIGWLERQNLRRTYNFNNCEKCLVAQYFTAIGHDWQVDDNYSKYRELITGPLYAAAYPRPRSFKAALERARAL